MQTLSAIFTEINKNDLPELERLLNMIEDKKFQEEPWTTAQFLDATKEFYFLQFRILGTNIVDKNINELDPEEREWLSSRLREIATRIRQHFIGIIVAIAPAIWHMKEEQVVIVQGIQRILAQQLDTLHLHHRIAKLSKSKYDDSERGLSTPLTRGAHSADPQDLFDWNWYSYSNNLGPNDSLCSPFMPYGTTRPSLDQKGLEWLIHVSACNNSNPTLLVETLENGLRLLVEGTTQRIEEVFEEAQQTWKIISATENETVQHVIQFIQRSNFLSLQNLEPIQQVLISTTQPIFETTQHAIQPGITAVAHHSTPPKSLFFRLYYFRQHRHIFFSKFSSLV